MLWKKVVVLTHLEHLIGYFASRNHQGTKWITGRDEEESHVRKRRNTKQTHGKAPCLISQSINQC